MARPLQTGVIRTDSATVDAAGDARIAIASPGSLSWSVSQVSIEMFAAPAGAQCVLRRNGSFVTFMIATGDAAGGDPSIMLRPGDTMTIEWSICTPGDEGRSLIVYDEIGWSA